MFASMSVRVGKAEIATLRSAPPRRDPVRASAAGGGLPRAFDVSILMALVFYGNDVADLDLERRDIDLASVDLDMSVIDKLACLTARSRKTRRDRQRCQAAVPA